MKNIFFVLLVVFANTVFSQTKKPVIQKATSQQPTSATTFVRNIAVTIKPYKNTVVYLGSYYGKGKTLADSAVVDGNSKGFFKGKEKLTPGIYFIVSPTYNILFDVLIDDKQQFSIVYDTLTKALPIITGSTDNDLFKNYSTFSNAKGMVLNELNNSYSKATTKQDSTAIRNKSIAANKELEEYRNDIIKKNPKSLLSVLFNTMKLPETPAIPIVKGKADSTYPYYFVKEHYWDNVAFNNPTLLRTPFFETKLDNYFKYYVNPEPDSIFAEVKYMLLYARSNKEMYAYLLTKFTNKYINPEFMGQDKVFVRLFENFYAKGDTTYLNPASRKTIIDRAYSLMANQIGAQAPTLDLVDTLGKIVPMYGLKSKLTVVIFWDPTCGHCKEELPRYDSIYTAKWKALDVKMYSVNVAVTDNTMKELGKFVQEKNFSKDWVHVSQSKAARDEEQKNGQPNFRQLYDVYKTPTIYLLNDKKQIIAKQLSVEQFDELITLKAKTK